LLNILIALYNSAYEDIAGNAIDEYMAIFALKTMQFVRAPDENVFIPRGSSYSAADTALTNGEPTSVQPTRNLLSGSPLRVVDAARVLRQAKRGHHGYHLLTTLTHHRDD
jgi:hypothetical protein